MPSTAGLRRLAFKQAFAQVNWRLRREGAHDRAVLDALTADLAALEADHLAVTGDLVNLTRPDEVAAARAWLETLAPSETVSVVPGNHDALVEVPWGAGFEAWQAWMSDTGRGDDGEGRGTASSRGLAANASSSAEAARAQLFPFVRRIGPIALVGLSTAVPTRPFWSSGRLGADQLQRLGDALGQLGDEGLLRVVLIHHPPIATLATRRSGLDDVADLAHVFKTVGAELVLHGHLHRFVLASMRGPEGAIPVVGVPSASFGRGPAARLAAYHVFSFGHDGDPGLVRLERRGLAVEGGPVTSLGGRTLRVPRRLQDSLAVTAE